MIEGNKGDKKYINDPARWLDELLPHRTQVLLVLQFSNSSQLEKALMEEAVGRMRRDRTYKQIDCGMRDVCVDKSIPFFEYFSRADWDTDAFGVCVVDYMHSLELGLYKEIAKALAGQVIASGAEATRKFKSIAAELHTFGVLGLDATIFRPRDVRPTSETDLFASFGQGHAVCARVQIARATIPVYF